jgi:hypothetical protein
MTSFSFFSICGGAMEGHGVAVEEIVEERGR